jgi:hypothetical protein
MFAANEAKVHLEFWGGRRSGHLNTTAVLQRALFVLIGPERLSILTFYRSFRDEMPRFSQALDPVLSAVNDFGGTVNSSEPAAEVISPAS